MIFKRFARRLIRYGVMKARESRFIRESVIQAGQHHYEICGTFTDSRGATFDLLAGLRDDLKPNWRSMLNYNRYSREPTKRSVSETITASRISITAMLNCLSIFGFDVPGKRVAEIGCYGGARTLAFAETGPLEVVGSDLPEYFALQRPTGYVSERSTTEETNLLDALRQTFIEAMPNANQNAGSISFVDDDICDSTLASGYFDLVFSWEVLEHVRNPKAMFAHINRILKPGEGLAFHEYNPFFSATGGHSLCTLDFPWGHARLDSNDFKRYVREIRPAEAQQDIRYYENNLNRMTLSDLQRFSHEAGLENLALIPWVDRRDLDRLNEDILRQSKQVFPSVTLQDLVSPTVWVVQMKK